VIYLNNPCRVDPHAAPPGHTNLFAVLTVPAMHDHLDWEQESARLRTVTRQELNRFGLGFDDSDIIFERQQDPRYFQSAHGSWRGSLYGPDEKERLWGLFSLGPRDPQFRNLTYAGGTAQPGAGLPMVTLSGKFAADALPAP
jgi:phytoene dehydrogenase-like protein